jgi:hypothetical protein
MPAPVIAQLKDDFGAEVIKKAFTGAGIKRYADLTPEKATEIREQLAMDGEAA